MILWRRFNRAGMSFARLAAGRHYWIAALALAAFFIVLEAAFGLSMARPMGKGEFLWKPSLAVGGWVGAAVGLVAFLVIAVLMHGAGELGNFSQQPEPSQESQELGEAECSVASELWDRHCDSETEPEHESGTGL
jgi:hypothetical protein